MQKNLNSRSSPNTQNDSLSPELHFLIACCQTDPSEEDIKAICSFIQHSTFNIAPSGNALGVQNLLTLSSQHGILPLVYKTIKNLQSDNSSIRQSALFGFAPPDEHKCPWGEIADTPVSKEQEGCNIAPSGNALGVQNFLLELKPHYMSIVQRNMLMTSELIKIMRLLKENNIEALAFKGPALSQMAYGDITLRQYVDLDILVDEEDAFKAGKLMSENGHIAILPLTILSNKTCLHTAKDFSLMSEPGGVHTELHWRLFEKKYNISLLSCAVEKKCQTVKINNREINTLQNELLLVYLCLHGAKHAFERIEWICDIDRLIRSSEINWEEAITIAEQSHSKRSFYLGLSLAHHLLHTELPANIIKNIDADDIKTLHVMTLKQMSGKNNERSDFKKNRETFFYQSRLFDKKSDMIRFYLSTFFKVSTMDCQTFVLPEKLKFLYIILRPIRLAWSYGKGVLST